MCTQGANRGGEYVREMTAQDNVHAHSRSVPQDAPTTDGSSASTHAHTDKATSTHTCEPLINGAGAVLDSPTGDAHAHTSTHAPTPTLTHTHTPSSELSGGVAQGVHAHAHTLTHTSVYGGGCEGGGVRGGDFVTEEDTSTVSLDSAGQRSLSAAAAPAHTTPSLAPRPPTPTSRTRSPPTLPSSSLSSSSPLHPSKASSTRAHPPLLLLLTTATCLLHAVYTLGSARSNGHKIGVYTGAGHTGAPAAYTLAHWATQTFPHNRNVHITALQALTHYAMTSHRAHQCVCARDGVCGCGWDVRDAEALVMDSMRAYPTSAPLQSAGILALRHLHTHTHTTRTVGGPEGTCVGKEGRVCVSRSGDACGDGHGGGGGVAGMTHAGDVGARHHAHLSVGGRGCEGGRDNGTSSCDALSLIRAAMRMHPTDSVVQQRGREAVTYILA